MTQNNKKLGELESGFDSGRALSSTYDGKVKSTLEFYKIKRKDDSSSGDLNLDYEPKKGLNRGSSYKNLRPKKDYFGKKRMSRDEKLRNFHSQNAQILLSQSLSQTP